MSDTQSVVVTGISSELGRVLAIELAKNPEARVIGTMRRTLGKEDRYPSNIRIVDACDLTNQDCCIRVAEIAKTAFPGSFGVIHSVGDFWDHVPFSDYDPAHAKALFESHVATFYNTLHALIPVMKSRGGGSVIAFSCNSVRYNYPWMAAFTAAKSAIDSLVRSLANEYSGDGLRLNSLVLASLQTTKVHKAKPHGDYAHFIPPEQITPIVRFLLSDHARLVNGNTINLFVHSDEFYNAGYFKRIAR